jgi:signal transduction histidine kinase
MNNQKPPYHELESKMEEAEKLIHALRTQQVDAIVGERHIMLVRLEQAEENLKSSRNQLRALASYLLSARENERAVIARELHDEFGQALTSLQLGLSWISRKLTPGQQPLQKKIKSLSATTTTLMRSVKNIASELRPGVLNELGLVKTLKSEAREFEGHTGIHCRFKTNTAKAKFDRSAAVAIFRIVQAALTNIARHAHASRAHIALTKRKNGVTLTVTDNGKGISRKLVYGHDSLGITGMRERALALGGTFTLGGSGSKGTILTVQIPLSRVIIGPASSRSRNTPQF